MGTPAANSAAASTIQDGVPRSGEGRSVFIAGKKKLKLAVLVELREWEEEFRCFAMVGQDLLGQVYPGQQRQLGEAVWYGHISQREEVQARVR